MTEQRLDEILKRLIRRRPGLRRELAHQQVFARWESIAGSKLAQYVVPLEVRGQTLVLGARGSAWAQELQSFQDELLRRTAQEVGKGVIRDLRVKVIGSVPNRFHAQNVSKTSVSNARPHVHSRPSRDREAREILQDIQDAHRHRKASFQTAGCPRCHDCGEYYRAEMGVVLGTGEHVCPHCARLFQEDARNHVRQMIEELPWVDTHELHRRVGLDKEQCYRVKKERIEYWFARVHESVRRAQEGFAPQPDFRKRVLQILMASYETACPPLDSHRVGQLIGVEAASLFFSRCAGDGKKG